jgi:C4-dicarboxylate-specific signal transduction histidine kinase
MRGSRSEQESGQDERKSGADNALSVRKLAHELNSLLDGSMRCIRLAEKALDVAAAAPGEGQSFEDALTRLRTAHLAMTDMAAVLDRAMNGGQVGRCELLGSSRTLGDEVEQVLATLRPLAEHDRVVLEVEVTPEAAALPAGPLGPVLANGLRNAIEACSVDGLTMRRVAVSIALGRGTSDLLILISDSGCGLSAAPAAGCTTKAGGHGLGLGVCRDIVTELGGRIELTNIPFGRGAVLDVSIPLRSLVQS